MTLPSRRVVVQGGLASLAALVAPVALSGCASSKRRPPGAEDDTGGEVMPDVPPLRSLISDIGPLGEANADGLRLPAGFSARIVARSGQPVLPDGYVWHFWPDGGAC